MERDPSPEDAPDAEELRAAAALGEALEGQSVHADLPETALETASLLRFSGVQGQLNAARRAEIRESLLSNLPAARPRRARLWGWLALWIPVAVGATAGVTFAVRALLETPEPAETAASAAPADPIASLAKAGAADEAVMDKGVGEVAAAAQAYRSAHLARTPELDRVHAQIDAATSEAELERLAQRSLDLALAPSDQAWSEEQTHVVRQDLFCRLAEGALRVGQPERALEWTQRGIDLDGPPTPIMAQLVAIDGHARAALGDRLGAAKSYLRALEINETLLDKHLDGP